MAPTIPTRQLGKDGPQVTAPGWGAMQMGYPLRLLVDKVLTQCRTPAVLYGASDSDAERLDFMDQVYDRGSWMWDTSESYSDSEDMIGKWFARSGKRDDVRLPTLTPG
ncbi:MAG: hypothetical protein Q9212_004358 [Teloschistes hypoglaucus]